MSLIVEDGTVVAGAESYCSVATATTYHANRGNAAWASLPLTMMEQCLRKATDYMVGAYRLRWKGTRTSPTQVLDWPRAGVFTEPVLYGRDLNGMAYAFPTNVVPSEVQQACAEFALRSSSADLASDLSQQVVREQVGQISIEYDKGSPEYARYRAVDLRLKAYLRNNAGIMAKVIRS